VSITVRNQGNAAAPTSSTRLTADGITKCGAIATPTILAGDSTIVTCSAGSFSTGLHSFVACADVNGQVPESDEGNNCHTTSVRMWATLHFHVNASGTGDYPTIQAAIDAASDYGAVELANGTYTGTGNRDVDFKGKKVRVYSQSGVPSQCVINCQGSGAANHRGFLFFHNEDQPGAGGHQDRGGYAIRVARSLLARPPRLKNLLVDHCTSSTDGGVSFDHSPILRIAASNTAPRSRRRRRPVRARLFLAAFTNVLPQEPGVGPRRRLQRQCFPTLQYCFST
jgi:hypothetical protein